MVLLDVAIGSEAELEALLVETPALIEPDFKIITHQRKTHGLNRLDILGLDSQKVLTLIELKLDEDDGQLQQCLEYYSWILEQSLDWIRDAYSVDISEAMPQIFLIARRFSPKLKLESKFIRDDIRIRFFRYLAFDIDGRTEIKLIEDDIPELHEIEEKPKTFDDHSNYISEESVRALFKKAHNDLLLLTLNLESRSTYSTYWFKGKKFCELIPRKNRFDVWYKLPVDTSFGWGEDPDVVSSESDWSKTYNQIKFNLERFKKSM